MRPTCVVGGWVCIGLMLALPAMGSPPETKPYDMLKRASDAVRLSRTWQATITMTVDGSPSGPVAMLYDVKRSGKKVWARVAIAPSRAQGARGRAPATPQPVSVVDDGRTTWVYMPSLKLYRRDAGGAGAGVIPFQQIFMQAATTSNLRPAVSSKINGRAAYLIEGTPRKPGAGNENHISVWVDQSTGRFVQMIAKGRTVAVRGAPPHTQTVTLRVTNEQLNAPIPDSLFHFVPPRGAKEARARAELRMPPVARGRLPDSPRR